MRIAGWSVKAFEARRDFLAEYRGFASLGVHHLSGRGEGTGVTIQMSERLLNWACPDPSDVLVDVGCGDGTLLLMRILRSSAIGESRGRSIGILPSEDEASVLRRHLELEVRSGSSPEIVVGEASQLPLPDDLADLVIMNAVLYMLEPTAAQAALAECHRIIKPGGRLLIGDLPDCDELALGDRPSVGDYLMRSWTAGLQPGLMSIVRVIRSTFTARPLFIERRTPFFSTPQALKGDLATHGFELIDQRPGYPWDGDGSQPQVGHRRDYLAVRLP